MPHVIDFAYAFIISSLSIIALIAFPVIIALLIIHQWMKSITKNDLRVKKLHGTTDFTRYIFTFHTNKGLGSQGLFWFSIILPFIYFLVFGFVAWHGYHLRLDAEGFKNFISISALPLGMLSLAVPLSVSVARFHASKQTAKQIEIVSQKNNVDLYNSHRKELFGYFQQLGEFKYLDNFIVKNKVHPRVYKNYFFGDPSEGVPKIKEKDFLKMERLLHKLSEALIDIIESEDLDIAFNIYVIDFGGDVFEAANCLGIPEVNELMDSSPKVPVRYYGQNLHLDTVGKTTDEAVSAFRAIENFYHNLCDFADYESDYFKDHKQHKNFNEAIRLNGKKDASEKIIERLHEQHIKQAMENER